MNKHDTKDKVVFGFWIYLMTDLVMFAALFAAFAVLRGNTFGGPDGREIFNLPSVLAETLILLTSSFTVGLGMLAANQKNKNQTLAWFGLTFLLGISFLFMEVKEFSRLLAEGHGPQISAFLSSFFTLVGTHGLHIAVGLFWLIILFIKIWRDDLNTNSLRQLTLLSLFWHFLDIVWIFIFTIVYLVGSK